MIIQLKYIYITLWYIESNQENSDQTASKIFELDSKCS